MQKTESALEWNGSIREDIMWEYDYNEIILDSTDTVLLDKIKTNPEAYVNYKCETEKPNTAAVLQALTDRIAALEAAAAQQAQTTAALNTLGVDTTPDEITALNTLGIETEE